jgi:hypothetical protein
MSENVRRQKWLAISFFLVCVLIFAALIYTIIFGSTDRAYSNLMASARSKPEGSTNNKGISQDGLLVMLKDQQVDLENVLLTYRGLSSGAVFLDLVLLDLDPQYVYHRQIPVEAARQGFQVSNRRFKVISANRQRLKLLLISPSI